MTKRTLPPPAGSPRGLRPTVTDDACSKELPQGLHIKHNHREGSHGKSLSPLTSASPKAPDLPDCWIRPGLCGYNHLAFFLHCLNYSLFCLLINLETSSPPPKPSGARPACPQHGEAGPRLSWRHLSEGLAVTSHASGLGSPEGLSVVEVVSAEGSVFP